MFIVVSPYLTTRLDALPDQDFRLEPQPVDIVPDLCTAFELSCEVTGHSNGATAHAQTPQSEFF